MILNSSGSSGQWEQPQVVIGPDQLGRGLDSLVAQMARKGDVALGGSIKLKIPSTRGKNNWLPEQSLEVMLNPENLYIERFKLGTGKNAETKTGGGERYPTRPLRILNQFEIRSLILNFHKYAGRHKTPWLKLSLAAPPRELALLTDLVAMIAEGTRFPDIRNHIATLEEELRVSSHGGGGSSISKETRRDSETVRRYAKWELALKRLESQYDPNRVIPRHYVNRWEKRYQEGNATFGKNGWKRG